jgi:hypothetical protein
LPMKLPPPADSWNVSKNLPAISVPLSRWVQTPEIFPGIEYPYRAISL